MPYAATRRASLALLALVIATPAAAHHRQTPLVVKFPVAPNTPLPRVPALGAKTFALAVDTGAGQQIVAISPWKDRQTFTQMSPIGTPGAHANPAVSSTGRVIGFDSASDPAGTGLPGRQVDTAFKTTIVPVSDDPTGSSSNPSVDTVGSRVAFESTGDLAGTGSGGTRQIFVSDRDGSVRQLSRGSGTSRNVVVSAKHDLVAFESSSNPTTGADTGIAQIWTGNVITGAAAPITNGLGPSTNAAISNDGRIVAWDSTADLAGTLANTGVSQIFIYDTRTKTYARITNDAGGCSLPSVYKVHSDWRVTFVCSGTPYYYMLRDDQRFRVQADGGVTQRIVAELGIHFLLLSTTADLVAGSGATPGSQIYLVNLFKRPAVAVAGTSTWFPTRGIPAH